VLKQRIIAVLPILNGIVVQSMGFKRFLPVGKPPVAVEHLNRWGIDEIAMLDISRSASSGFALQTYVADVAPYCLVPLAAGGGIRTIDHVRDVIKSGADRVILNTAVFDNPALLSHAAERFGIQCIIAAIDARQTDGGRYEAFVDGGARATGMHPIQLAKQAEDSGAGEILLQNIDRDGAKTGYELELIEEVASAVSIPVIALGGVGVPNHFLPAAKIEGVGGLAAGNYFHYTEHTATVAKAALAAGGVRLRHDSYADYRESKINAQGRLQKLPDKKLEALLFVHYTDEVI